MYTYSAASTWSHSAVPLDGSLDVRSLGLAGALSPL
jgi:hypothetical protein